MAKRKPTSASRYTIRDLLNQLRDLATNPHHARWLCPLLIAADAALCAAIILKVPYTEIDWRAYMQQIETILSGERDYIKIRGDTGPLVYPAGHVWIYSALYWLTDKGRDIRVAQWIFAGVYLATEAVVMGCYRLAEAPPYIYVLLVLSKRLHSIYMLRMFNDCFSVAALFLAIYAYQKRSWKAGSLLFSLGVAIKMNVLLALPGVAAILLQGPLLGRVWEGSLEQGALMGLLQVLLGLPFLLQNPQSYVFKAFEFSRVFMFKWTVNWRFVGEETFLSTQFSSMLLSCHILLLLLFIFSRWLNPLQSQRLSLFSALFKKTSPTKRTSVHRLIDPDFVLTTTLTAAVIGMLCARSLHYQFYSWLAWASPFLLYKAAFPPPVKVLLWAAQERAWNVYPSTSVSSIVVVAVLFATVSGVWFGTADERTTARSPGRRQRQAPRRVKG